LQAGDAPVKKTARASLRLLGSVGEPINPEAWNGTTAWSATNRCPIVDTWWQTETGGILNHAAARRHQAQARLGDEPLLRRGARDRRRRWQGCWRASVRAISASPDHGRGKCAPSMATTPASSRPILPPTRGKYFTGDGCRRDADGYY